MNESSAGEAIAKRLPKGLLEPLLWQLYHAVSVGTSIEAAALGHVEELSLRLLGHLLAAEPRTPQDVEATVAATFPAPLRAWAVAEAAGRRLSSKSAAKTVAKIHSTLLKEGFLKAKPDMALTVYIVAVLEYVAADIIKLTGNYVKNIRQNLITLQDLQIALQADRVLMDMFYHDSEEEACLSSLPLNGFLSGSLVGSVDALSDASGGSGLGSGIGQVVLGALVGPGGGSEAAAKDLVHFEQLYLRDLHLLLHVFRRALAAALPGERAKEVEGVFGVLGELHELSMKLVRLLEDSVELEEQPRLGAPFLDLAEGAEFDVYITYAHQLPQAPINLGHLLAVPGVKARLQDSDASFYLAMRWVLPKLLWLPIHHAWQYLEALEALSLLADDEGDREDFASTLSLLSGLKAKLVDVRAGPDFSYSAPWHPGWMAGAGGSSLHMRKMRDVQESIEGWDGRHIVHSCTEFLTEGTLEKLRHPGAKLGPTETLRSGRAPRLTERYAFLFDNLIVLCKPIAPTAANPRKLYKMKEKFSIRRVDVHDRDDLDGELGFGFELRSRGGGSGPETSVILLSRSAEEKAAWMAALVFRQSRSMLDRILESVQKEEEKRIPLVLPSPDQYRFTEPDSEENIIFEDYSSSSGIPIVKGGTLLKLVERLTFHMHTDSKFLRTFLTTYRSFCAPQELLTLLAERFAVPTPDVLLQLQNERPPQASPLGPLAVVALEPLQPGDSDAEQSLQRFRKEYMRPVQIRVLSVIRQWVSRHWYDFEEDDALLGRVKEFLEALPGNAMRKMGRSILSVMGKRERLTAGDEETERRQKTSAFGPQAPEPLWHLAGPDAPEVPFDLMSLHPREIGRQVTLLESELYRAVKPIELVGAAWMKKDKNKRSPQLLKLTGHATKITYWLEAQIVETGNLEERVALMNRIIEIMLVFEELNNFNGLEEFYSAFTSASVWRLRASWERLDPKLFKAYERFRETLEDPHKKALMRRLRSVNPPLVPFCGLYLSNICFLEEGNPLFLRAAAANPGLLGDDVDPDTVSVTTVGGSSPAAAIISFHKCRKIADVIGEIQMYQNQPYALQPVPTIKEFFESLNPMGEFGGERNALETYLYNRSLEVEPKDPEPLPKFPLLRKPEYLKSPGIKLGPGRTLGRPSPRPSMPHPDSSSLRAARDNSASDFAVVDIRPGDPRGPQHIADLPDLRRRLPSLVSPSPLTSPPPPLPPKSAGRPPHPGHPGPRPRTSPASPLSPAGAAPAFAFLADPFGGPTLSMDAPAIPPREPFARAALPPPLSPTFVEAEAARWLPDLASPPPPLPPRRSPTNSSPPPRPPKTSGPGLPLSPSPTPPPLPPKTYKRSS